ncbi:hypothetical protein PsorP6_013166 [Peronosclerospora sorghi]|uniref:Uncharacterized protein n=1 Tax=Peronosclerospora sorghi TaxID=230839 RepID=A0ACC0WGA1_9STRA|nr:hypothetical protein PsorP6_013166 [Peronosclerospora sorghi]
MLPVGVGGSAVRFEMALSILMRHLAAPETAIPELSALIKLYGKKSPNLAGIELLLGAEDKRDEDERAANDGAKDDESDANDSGVGRGRKKEDVLVALAVAAGDLVAAADDKALSLDFSLSPILNGEIGRQGK